MEDKTTYSVNASSGFLLIIALGIILIGLAVTQTAKACNDGLTADEALKMKNTIKRLDKDIDKLKARKPCKCQKPNVR